MSYVSYVKTKRKLKNTLYVKTPIQDIAYNTLHIIRTYNLNHDCKCKHYMLKLE